MARYLVTGAAGFIGCEVALRLLVAGHDVVGLDNLSPYYDVALKRGRLARLRPLARFHFEELDIADGVALRGLFAAQRFDRVVHLAAQPGVRFSIEHPDAYVHSNLVGFFNVLERCRAQAVEHLVFASSSSVYGANTRLPYSVHDNVDHPISFYAATKKANELMAHSYAHLYRLPMTGLRFFTVYGPWGRPDMAPMKFLKALFAGAPIELYNRGMMRRDFTYIDDIAEGVVRVADRVPGPDHGWRGDDPDPGSSAAPYRLYNIGNHQPVGLRDFVAFLERAAGRTANVRMVEAQPGEVEATFADVDDLRRDTGFAPATPFEEGARKLVEWYRSYYAV